MPFVLMIVLLSLFALWATFILAPSVMLFRFIFRPRSVPEPTAETLGATYMAPYAGKVLDAALFLGSLPHERVTVTAPDGATLCADCRRGENNKLAIFFHGYNAGPMKNFAVHLKLFHERGWSTLAVYERAHGVSGGKHTGLALLERKDVPLWLEKGRSLFPGASVVLYGTSMGGAALAYALPTLDPDAVCAAVVDCAFTSPYGQLYKDCINRRLPAPALMPLINLWTKAAMKADLRERVPDSLAKTKIPVFFIHGDADTTVPIEEGRENYAACAAEKDRLFVPGAPHTAALIEGGKEAEDKLFAFLDKHVKNNSKGDTI